jgi:hypothetical protein
VRQPAASAAKNVNIKSLRMAGFLRKCIRFPGARLWVKQLYLTVFDVQMKHVDIFQPASFLRVEKVLQFTWPAHRG